MIKRAASCAEGQAKWITRRVGRSDPRGGLPTQESIPRTTFWVSARSPLLTRLTELTLYADEELMQLVQQGNPQAFELIYDRHGGAAFSLAYRMVADRVAAEDVVQEAFLSIWRSRERYRRERGSLRTWVLGIVHHRAIDALRRNLVHDRKRASAEGLEERQEAPELTATEVIRRDEARIIRTALGTLPKEQRQTIELAYFGGFTHTEIADQLEMPIGTVKGRMRLGLNKMRRALDEEAA